MQKITTYLTFNDQAEEAAKLYTSIFKNSKITSVTRYPEGGPGPAGSVLTASFEIDGQEFVALNGGPSFSFCEGMSLSVSCDDQAEIDDLWEKLTAGGGEPGECAWLKDRFGVSWQIVPKDLGELMSDPDPARAHSVMQAMLKMSKIDIAALEHARAHPGAA